MNGNRRLRRLTAAWAIVGAASCWSAASIGQTSLPSDAAPGISVHGIGEARAKPDTVSIDIALSGQGELTGDAVVKYRDARRRFEAALNELKFEGLAIEDRGVTIGSSLPQPQMQRMMMQGLNVANELVKPSMTMSGRLTVRLGGVRDKAPEEVMETIGRLLDTARDSGAGVGATADEMTLAMQYGQQVRANVVRFVLRDFTDLREQAYESAFNDARERAERLAKLSSTKLLGVRSVREVQISGDDPNSSTQNVRQPWESAAAAAAAASRAPEIASDVFSEIPVRVRLFVCFDVDQPKTESLSR